MNSETDDVHSGAAVGSGGTVWTPRLLLLGPALIQLVVAYIIYQDVRSGERLTPVLASLMLLVLGGTGGIAAGVFGRSRRLLQFGCLSALSGIALPMAILSAAAPIDNHTSALPLLGEFDTEALGLITFHRTFLELPFWGLYAIIVFAGYLGSRRTANRAAPGQTPAGPSPLQPPSGKR